ncbi:alcohol dehydrogenase catalytic domain-containing protein [Nocardia terpenica]|uniref:alcohol dehydrogenase catalytic domain-containing protein n=1 Tax=Nocardia terpenica TaxID=455432 RepID=UPI001EEC66AB|nr:hypothetical protein [Nocardia terpenica]
MRAVVIGAGGRFGLQRRDDPVPGPGEVLVDIRAAGLNAADLQQARGDYPAPAGWPADIPGTDAYDRLVAPGKFGKIVFTR